MDRGAVREQPANGGVVALDELRRGLAAARLEHRLVAGAVSHEIRNMCLAIRVVAANLRQRSGLAEDADFKTLTTLVESLGSIASFELRNGKDENAGWVNLNTTLEQLRVAAGRLMDGDGSIFREGVAPRRRGLRPVPRIRPQQAFSGLTCSPCGA